MPDDAQRLEEWKSRGEPRPVRLVSRTDQETRADVYIRLLRTKERMVRALVALAACWALAAVSILIPVAHFVLVPGFLLAGPLAAWFRYRPRSIVLGGAATCPACDAALTVPAQSEHWPLSATCDHCMESIEIRE